MKAVRGIRKAMVFTGVTGLYRFSSTQPGALPGYSAGHPPRSFISAVAGNWYGCPAIRTHCEKVQMRQEHWGAKYEFLGSQS